MLAAPPPPWDAPPEYYAHSSLFRDGIP
jgi:hypothetical protein